MIIGGWVIYTIITQLFMEQIRIRADTPPCFFLVMDNRLKMALQLFCLGHKLETQAPSVKIQK